MAGEPITPEEMIAMFGEAMPREAVSLAWNADDTKTIGEIRDELRALAKRTKARRDDGDIVDLLKMAARNGNALAGEAVDEIERLRAALREIAEDDIYLRNCATWHDTGKMKTGVQAFARAALENK